MSKTDPVTKQVAVPMDLPRDPEEYRATVHFGQQIKQRVPDHHQDMAVRETIEFGDHKGSYHPDGVKKFDYVLQYFKVIGETWTVVVGIIPKAFLDPETKHLAVTIYPTEQ